MNQSHSNLVTEYMEFVKFQRIRHVKEIQNYFKGIVDNRLLEGTYTSEEVEGILQDLCNCICSEIESELISTSHMNVLLLRQLFEQAEEFGLTLNGSISEMQNGELLEKMRAQEMPNISINLSNNKTLVEEELKDEARNDILVKSHELRDCEVALENLKKILCKKNEVIKRLRERLLQYEEPNE